MLLGKWDVEVNGQDYAVSVERSETGKDVIRVNGRVVAKPMGAEETERSITVAGGPYTLRRVNPNAYDLEVDEVAAETARARTMETANYVLAHSNAPVPLAKGSFFKKLPGFGYLVVIALVVGLMYLAQGPGYDKIASARVHRVLTEMSEMRDSQFAVSFWFKNKKSLESSDMWIASDRFDKWRQQKDLYRKIDSFEILTAEVSRDDPNTAIVAFKIEGRDYKVKVPKDLPISWVE